jgi:hypothetical protein
MDDFLKSGYFNDIRKDCRSRGNDLYIANNPKNKGGNGYAITNNNIEFAQGKYFMFFANDDVILPNHFENYLSEIENSDYDFVYFTGEKAPSDTNKDGILDQDFVERDDNKLIWKPANGYRRITQKNCYDSSIITTIAPGCGYVAIRIQPKPGFNSGSAVVPMETKMKCSPEGNDCSKSTFLKISYANCASAQTNVGWKLIQATTALCM